MTKTGGAAIQCPNCGMQFEAVATLSAESRMWFEIAPEPGQYLSAASVGRALESFDKVFEALGGAQGVSVKMMVTGLEYDEGKVRIGVNVVRFREPDALSAREAGDE